MMVIDNKFDVGQEVYLKTDPDQEARIVTAIKVNPYDLTYLLSSGTMSSEHYDIEITEEKSIVVQ